MERSDVVTISVVALLLLFAILSPFTFPVFFGSDFMGFIAGLCFFIVFFFIGLIVLVVGLLRGPNRQQQQQQVVVLGAGGAPVAGTTAVTRVRCPTCQHLNPTQARFCTQCATHLGSARP